MAAGGGGFSARGGIAAHLGPANMDISDTEFEQMLNQARESLIRGLLPQGFGLLRT
jgi:hypothetical protein